MILIQNQWPSTCSLPYPALPTSQKHTLEYLTRDDVSELNWRGKKSLSALGLCWHITSPCLLLFSALRIQMTDLLLFIHKSKLKCTHFIKNLHYTNQQPAFQCTVSIYQLFSNHLERNYNGKQQRFTIGFKKTIWTIVTWKIWNFHRYTFSLPIYLDKTLTKLISVFYKDVLTNYRQADSLQAELWGEPKL